MRAFCAQLVIPSGEVQEMQPCRGVSLVGAHEHVIATLHFQAALKAGHVNSPHPVPAAMPAACCRDLHHGFKPTITLSSLTCPDRGVLSQPQKN